MNEIWAEKFLPSKRTDHPYAIFIFQEIFTYHKYTDLWLI